MSRDILRAILKGDTDKVDLLLQKGHHIGHVTGKERWNYLHQSLMSITRPPPENSINYLIQKGVDVNAVDIYGNTPLHYAIRTKKYKLVNMLLDASADPNSINKDGVSPLREALLTKPFDYQSIRLLLEAKADVEQKTQGGSTVKEFAELIASDDIELMALFGK